jgi:flavin reductase (DIM6/NTAB) family NADH-FMN oxidoreductase RutF
MTDSNRFNEIHRTQVGKQVTIALNPEESIWKHFYTISPLVVIGTKEDNRYDLAPKHMAGPLGQENYFGFICTPEHATYHNAKRQGSFTVSFPKPEQITLASLAASPRCEEDAYTKSIVGLLPTIRGEIVDALFVSNSYLYLECVLHKVVDGFGKYSLVSGRIVKAQVDENYYKSSGRDDQSMLQQAPLVAFLAYSRFAVISDSYAFPMPKNFTHLDE